MIDRLRAWARTHSERDRYTPVGIAFHWIMAALVIAQLGWGWYMSLLPAGGDKLRAFETHSALGLPILVLGLGRLVWRVLIPGPVNDADVPGWQSRAASATHYVFYICFFGLPLSGWAMWSTVSTPGALYLGGVIPWPQLPLEQLSPELQWRILYVAENLHYWLILVLVVLIPLHVGAALKHHFWDRHDVLRGMIPEVPDEAPRHEPRPM
jgi:cytochrome b561